MPKIWLPDGGVNRQGKKISFADPSGVQRTAKSVWVNTGDGVNRKVFNGIQCRMHMEVKNYIPNPIHTTFGLNSDGSGFCAILNDSVKKYGFDFILNIKFLEPYPFVVSFSVPIFEYHFDKWATRMYTDDKIDIRVPTGEYFAGNDTSFTGPSQVIYPKGFFGSRNFTELNIICRGILSANAAQSGWCDFSWSSGGLVVLGQPITNIEII